MNLILESSTEEAGLEEAGLEEEETGVEPLEVTRSEADVGNIKEVDTMTESEAREEGDPGAEIHDMVVTEAEPGQEVDGEMPGAASVIYMVTQITGKQSDEVIDLTFFTDSDREEVFADEHAEDDIIVEEEVIVMKRKDKINMLTPAESMYQLAWKGKWPKPGTRMEITVGDILNEGEDQR